MKGHRPYDDTCSCWLCIEREDESGPRFSLRVPVLPILPALVVTLTLAGLVWLVTW